MANKVSFQYSLWTPPSLYGVSMDNIGAFFGGKYKTRSHSNREDGKITCLDRQSKGNLHGYHEVADTSTDPIVASLSRRK